MIEVRIISATTHDGLVLHLSSLPRGGDTFELDNRPYRVHKVLHRITTSNPERVQRVGQENGIPWEDGVPAECKHEIGLVLESL